jgi:alkylated DNA nucleotide flippase Atl1
MIANSHDDDVFKAKRKPKNPIKFEISLNEEQKRAKSIILDNPITVLKGMAGSGKTLVACQVALDMLFSKEVDKIVITRPTVSKEDIGFLPRFALLLDNIFHKLGLHGYAIISFILGLGCNVPGAMAMRLLEERREKFIAATLMAIAVPCMAQIAMIVGRCTPRMVGYAMAALPVNSDVPWQRVINSRGKISPHGDGIGTIMQRQLLESEGVAFDLQGATDPDIFGWLGI